MMTPTDRTVRRPWSRASRTPGPRIAARVAMAALRAVSPWSLVLFSVLLTESATAQPYTGDFYSVTRDGTLLRTDRAGNVTSLADAATLSDGIAVAWDNQGILWTEWGNALAPTPSRIHEWRNNADTVLFSTTAYQIEEVIVNQNGEIVFTGADRSMASPVTGVFKWHGGSTVTTIVTTAAFALPRPFLDGGMDINIETGNYLVAAGPVSWPELVQVWDVAEDGRFTSLVKRGTAAGGGEFSIHQDKNNGLIVQSGSTPRYGVIDSTGLRWEIQARPSGPPLTPFYYGVRMDRASVPTSLRRMYALYHHPTHQEVGFLFEVSEPTGLNTSYTGTSLVQATNTQGCRGMVFADEKNIGSLKTGAGAYVLNFNFPGEGGKRYAVGIGVTGYKPGLTLADGRHICLNVDALTFASLHNLLRPAFDPGPGTLDPTGNATGSIALGVDGLNVLLHMVAMTMSSGTIDTISSPTVFKL